MERAELFFQLYPAKTIKKNELEPIHDASPVRHRHSGPRQRVHGIFYDDELPPERAGTPTLLPGYISFDSGAPGRWPVSLCPSLSSSACVADHTPPERAHRD